MLDESIDSFQTQADLSVLLFFLKIQLQLLPRR